MKKLKYDIIKKLKMTATVKELDCGKCPINDGTHHRTCLAILRETIGTDILEGYLPIGHLYCCNDVRDACRQLWKDFESKRKLVKI